MKKCNKCFEFYTENPSRICDMCKMKKRSSETGVPFVGTIRIVKTKSVIWMWILFVIIVMIMYSQLIVQENIIRSLVCVMYD